ncbi:NAD(P)-binding protein [Daedaleopsis nitida]|nr:NAD(P)-binding protein [Daedaleopsis nitida]
MNDLVPAVVVLAALSAVLALPHLYRLASWIWLYFLRPSSVHKFRHGPTPYAIVTGATDGIGKALAAELLRQGFNLILHGRNESKMHNVVERLRALVPEKPDADIRYFIADAEQPGHNLDNLLYPFRDLHITLVFHNVGGCEVLPERIDDHPEDWLHALINKNALFSLFLTHALLPQLRRVAASGPVLVSFTGSIAADLSPPRLPIYAASKGFLLSLARGLDNDECLLAAPSGVRFCYLAVGSVHSENHTIPMPPTLSTPTSEDFAKSIIARLGCGQRCVTPYAVHSALQWMVGLMSDSSVDKFSADQMATMLKRSGRI